VVLTVCLVREEHDDVGLALRPQGIHVPQTGGTPEKVVQVRGNVTVLDIIDMLDATFFRSR
jgi:hypothetical protein